MAIFLHLHHCLAKTVSLEHSQVPMVWTTAPKVVTPDTRQVSTVFGKVVWGDWKVGVDSKKSLNAN